jgi:class 3 adenylate cyclase
MEPEQQRSVARVLRAALATDPARRPRAAGKLVESLRAVGRGEHPSGVVTLLATEVAGAGRLWTDDPDEMRVAMSRLRDVMDEVVGAGGGRVVTSMNEGDRTVAVFREASTAALSALELHDRVAREPFPPGIVVRLRVALAVGEAAVLDGVYIGAVVDHVIRLRSLAAPGTTVTSEATGELLVGLVGRDVSIVPLGAAASDELPDGASLFGITRPGAEHSAAIQVQPADRSIASLPAVPNATVSRREVVTEAALHPTTLVGVTLAGVSMIFLLVLAPELGMGGLSAAVLVLGVVVATSSFVREYSLTYRERRQRIDDNRRDRELADQRHRAGQERSELRRRLEMEYARVSSEHARDGERVLAALADEFDALTALLLRSQVRSSISASAVLPDLADETHRHGMSALSDALELLEFADGPQRRRLEGELDDIEARLARDSYADERARSQDEQRRDSHKQLLVRHDEARRRASDLLFEAERCTAALAEARIEVASVRAGDARVDIDAVVQTLQVTIRRVRDVQDEMRRLGY